ncbi:hypothetical protein ACI3LY_002115 [Candidozyma auris]|nr:hypothetical protein QG37_08240 [[Candida] auris]PIS53197.1 hypothetical protein CJI97_002858 [[Candida] auris]
MPNLQYSAASSSRIRKPKFSTKKSLLSPLKNKKKVKREVGPKEEEKSEDRLQVTGGNAHLDFQLKGYTGIVDAIVTVVHNQWAEQTCFHNRYFSETSCDSASGNDQLFALRGLSMEAKADIIKYRQQQLPSGGMLTLNQLYSMFMEQGNTFVDRSLELCIREGLVKKFVITNASPVVSRTGKGGHNAKVTYGYENMEVVVKTEHYLSVIEEMAENADSFTSTALHHFRDFVKSHSESLSISTADIAADELSALVKTGVVTLTSNHHNEINVHQYSLAYPRCGTFLKMINSGRVWLVKTLSKSKFKELLEEQLFEKWEGKNRANFRKPFYGYDLMWILADSLGAGVAEVFMTPVGRGWRLTGKI